MNGPLQGYHLMQLLHSAWPIIRNDLCVQEKAISKPCHGLAVFRMNLFFLSKMCVQRHARRMLTVISNRIYGQDPSISNQ